MAAKDDSGPMLLASVLPFYTLAILVYVIRMWARPSKKFALTATDYTITVALAAKTVSIGLMVAAIAHGFGRHNVDIPAAEEPLIKVYLLGIYMSGVAASCFARISIACLLLRFTTHRWWRILIWATMALQVVTVITYEVSQLVQCESVLTKINPHDSRCLPPKQVMAFTFLSFATAMTSDLICGTIPIFLIWPLSRSVVEKTLISILMASCIFATALGIPKLYYVLTFDFGSPDHLYLLVPEFFWCRMEEAIIIIAACAPLLKCPIERGLRRLGLPGFQALPREMNAVYLQGSDSSKDAGSSWQGSRSTRSDPEDRAAVTTTTCERPESI